ncbi:MAG: hypothetical protein BWK80_04445 [Desulfobacteraceae bacterium IS3]|nr:MAG: hypothetical protein BWK80_04445 [Desulfobacteraceae bacterium IS3]
MLKISFFGKTDVGLERTNNEDAFSICPEKGFCLVADGMGGEAAGEVASRIFAETAVEVFSETGGALEKILGQISRLLGFPEKLPSNDLSSETDSPVDAAKFSRSKEETLSLIECAFRLSNKRILKHVRQYPEHRGMGCTAELLAFFNQGFVFGHIGDSRIYRFKDGECPQISRDHSFVQKQIDAGIISPEQARTHPYRNVILRAVGIEKNLNPDFESGEIFPGDIFLLCSDGLSDMVEDMQIQEVLASEDGLAEKADKLVDLAKAAGGVDNITLVLCEISQDG